MIYKCDVCVCMCLRACACVLSGVMERESEGERIGGEGGGGGVITFCETEQGLTSPALWSTGRRGRLLSMSYALWSHGLLSYSQARRNRRNHAPEQSAGLAATGITRTQTWGNTGGRWAFAGKLPAGVSTARGDLGTPDPKGPVDGLVGGAR